MQAIDFTASKLIRIFSYFNLMDILLEYASYKLSYLSLEYDVRIDLHHSSPSQLASRTTSLIYEIFVQHLERYEKYIKVSQKVRDSKFYKHIVNFAASAAAQ